MGAELTWLLGMIEHNKRVRDAVGRFSMRGQCATERIRYYQYGIRCALKGGERG